MPMPLFFDPRHRDSWFERRRAGACILLDLGETGESVAETDMVDIWALERLVPSAVGRLRRHDWVKAPDPARH